MNVHAKPGASAYLRGPHDRAFKVSQMADILAEEIIRQAKDVDNLGDAESIVLMSKCPAINIKELAEKVVDNAPKVMSPAARHILARALYIATWSHMWTIETAGKRWDEGRSISEVKAAAYQQADRLLAEMVAAQESV